MPILHSCDCDERLLQLQPRLEAPPTEIPRKSVAKEAVWRLQQRLQQPLYYLNDAINEIVMSVVVAAA